MAFFSVDGDEYRGLVITNIQQNFEVLDGENAGRTKSGRMKRDVVGVYYNYSMTFAPNATPDSKAQFDKLFNILSSPDDSHMITMPHNQSTLTFEAYITSGERTLLLHTPQGGNQWGEMSISFIAMDPQRRP